MTLNAFDGHTHLFQTWFSHIVPCGIVGKGVTSLSGQLGRDVAIDEAKPALLEAFAKNFDCEVVEGQEPIGIRDLVPDEKTG